MPACCGVLSVRLISTDWPKFMAATGAESGEPNFSPLWKTSAVFFSQAQLPELDSRQVWVNVSLGLNCARSGSRTSVTCAAGWQAAAVAVRFGVGVDVGGTAMGVAMAGRGLGAAGAL